MSSLFPPTIQPLSFTPEPIIDLDEPTTMTKSRPSGTFLTSIPESIPSHHRTYQSDCGHHGPPPLKRSHSLLRSFSLRSRKSFSLQKSRHQSQAQQPPPLSPLASSLGIVGTAGTVSQPSTRKSKCSPDTNSSFSTWKKWRVKILNTLAGQDDEVDVTDIPDLVSCPMSREPTRRRRSTFLPFATVSCLAGALQILSSSSSSSDDSPYALASRLPSDQAESVIHQIRTLDADQDEDDNVKGKGKRNASSWDADGIAELIRQIDILWQTQSEIQTESDVDSDAILPLPPLSSSSPSLSTSSPLPPLPSNPSPSPLPSSLLLPLLPTNSSVSPPSSPPLPPLPTNSSVSPPSSPPLPPLPTNSPASPQGSPPLPPIPTNPSTSPSSSPPLPALPPPSSLLSTNVDLGLPSSSSTSTPECTPSKSISSIPDLKPCISPKRGAKFILGDESDLDYDSLVLSSSAAARAENTGSGAEPLILLNKSGQATDVGILRPSLTRREPFEPQDQNGTTCTSNTVASSTTNGTNTRRWTLSSALTDEDISDEGLVKELERMRELQEWDCTPIGMDGHEASSFSSSPSNPWLITQRALLTTRELILTERRYLSSLLLLLRPDSTLTPVPKMMISYVKELVGISERLLKGMEREPSVRGVAEAFVEIGGVDEAESAFVGWCGVVGGWFQDDLVVSGDTQVVVNNTRGKRKRSESGVGGRGSRDLIISEHEALGFSSSPTSVITGTATEHAHTLPLMRTVNTWRKSMPSIAGLGEGGVWRRDRDDGDSTCGHGHGGRMSPTLDAVSMPSTSNCKPIRKPAVRDLAILPTQRVMRYVLLYRDLLANSPPSSSSHIIVQRAVETACRIAEKCDRAQDNGAFIASGRGGGSARSSSSGCFDSMLNTNNSNPRKRPMTTPGPGLKVKTSWGHLSSPTKSHFLLSSSPVSISPSQVSSKSSWTPLPLTSSPKPLSLPLPVSPTKNRDRQATNPLPPPPPPSSFNSKIPIARSGQLLDSLSTCSNGSSTTTTTINSTSSSSSSISPPSFLSKSAASCLNGSSRMPRPLSPVSLMSLVKRGMSGAEPAGIGSESGLTRGYRSAIPTKV